MDKKKIFIGLGIIAVIGGIYYFYNKSKNAQAGNSGSTDSTGTGSSTGAETPANENAVTTPTTPAKVLTTRKDKKKACGRKPLNKNKKAEWQKCVDAGGTSGFEGDFDEFEESYMDFDNNFDITF